MKFLVLDKGLGPELPERPVSKLIKAKEVFASWVQAGKAESWYHFADRFGGMVILNVESLEELNKMLMDYPTRGIAITEVYPLVDPLLSFERQIAYAEKTEAS